jgi:hypothetical protein
MFASLQALDIAALDFMRTTLSFDSIWFQRTILFFSDLRAHPLRAVSDRISGSTACLLKNNGPKACRP